MGMTVFGLVRGIRLDLPIPIATIASEQGLAYLAVLPRPGYWLLASPGDRSNNPRRSTTQLFENGQPLGPAHSLREVIRSVGQGRFSHWRASLYFSTSDNSDPRTNGRVYRAVTMAKLPVWMWGVVAVIAGMLAWQVGRKSGVLDSDAIDYWQNRAVTWYIGQYGASFQMSNWLRHLPGIKPVCDLIAALERVFSTTPGWRGRLLRIAGLLLPFVVYGVLLHCLLPAKLLFVAYYA
ncbi:MAG: hypothetical protein ACJ788_24225, partial [Ktedonobacteraceae bacterium]